MRESDKKLGRKIKAIRLETFNDNLFWGINNMNG